MIGEPGAGPEAGAWVDGSRMVFRVADPGRRLAGARLQPDVRIPLEMGDPDGGTATVMDPAHPGRAPNPGTHNRTSGRDAFPPHLTGLAGQAGR